MQAHVCRKTPNAPLFNFPGKDRVIDMLRKDLADAGIPDQDEQGKVIDFHSFRHTTGTWLAQAGVHPRVAQEIMRHSDINLTMSTYTHVLREQHVEAVKKLPDLSGAYSRAENMATGTEGRDMFDLLRNLLPPCNQGRISANLDGQLARTTGVKESPVMSQKRRFPAKIEGKEETGERGFEPRLNDSESVVLPLHYSPLFTFWTGALYPRRGNASIEIGVCQVAFSDRAQVFSRLQAA